jgi:hypothetical protein
MSLAELDRRMKKRGCNNAQLNDAQNTIYITCVRSRTLEAFGASSSELGVITIVYQYEKLSVGITIVLTYVLRTLSGLLCLVA